MNPLGIVDQISTGEYYLFGEDEDHLVSVTKDSFLITGGLKHSYLITKFKQEKREISNYSYASLEAIDSKTNQPRLLEITKTEKRLIINIFRITKKEGQVGRGLTQIASISGQYCL